MGKPNVKKPREIPMCKWEDDDKVELREIR
jgi:hypothetical protein